MRRAAAALLAALLLAAGAPAANAQSLKGIRKDFAEIGESVIPATVIVRAPDAAPYLTGSSGVIVHADGYVLSDADATITRVEQQPDGTRVKHHGIDAVVRLPAPDHRSFRALLVKRDEETDTSLLKIVDPPRDLPVVAVGESNPLHVGNFLVVVGNAFGTGAESEPALSMGVVSALIPRRGLPGGRYETIYTAAAVNPGCNGGPVMDLSGRVVGIVSTYETDELSPFRALGKITPIDRLRPRYEDVEGCEKAFPPPDPAGRPPRDAGILEDAFEILARHVGVSLASIEVDRPGAVGTFKWPVPGQPEPVDIPRYAGPYSALVLSKDGYLLTATANLWEFDKIAGVTVHLPRGRTLPGKIVARDRYRGFALLKVEADDLVPLPPTTEKDLVVGRFALAFGNPYGGDRTGSPLFTFGVVSNLHRINPQVDAIQTDAGMNDAMVGGALVTLDGKLLGLTVPFNPDRFGRNSGIGFAVPLGAIQQSLPRLKEGRDVEPGFLGANIAEGPEGIVFPQVTPDGPAGKGGLRNGDVLLEVDGKPASDYPSPAEFIEYIQAKGPGAVLRLKVLRGALQEELKIVLGSRPGD